MNVQPIPYQIDYTSSSSGKNIPTSKRRVRWVFGFANMSAIKSNLQGVECRGEEHEIVLVTSILTGKRVVLFDGNVQHRSIQENKSIMHFTCSFEFSKIHHAHIEANLGLVRIGDDMKHFELFIDGQNFNDMDRLYELGMNDNEKRYLKQKSGNNYYRSSPIDDGYNDNHNNNSMIEYRPKVYAPSVPRPARIPSVKKMSIIPKNYHAYEPRTKDEEDKMMELAMKESLGDVADADVASKTKEEKKPLEATPADDETWQDLIDFGTCTEFYPAHAPIRPNPQHVTAPTHATPFDQVPIPDFSAASHADANQPQQSSTYHQYNSNHTNNIASTSYNPTAHTHNTPSYYHNHSNHISQFDANASNYTNHPYSYATAPYNDVRET